MNGWPDDLERRERLSEGLAHLDRLAVGGTLRSAPRQFRLPRITWAIIGMLSALLWGGIIYGALVAAGVE